MKLPEKGSFGYFDKKKKLTLTAAIFSFLVVAAIYATGILIYHTNKSIFTVIAALSVLPAAKVLISFLIISAYRSLPVCQKDELCLLTAERKDCRILYDILLASEEKALIAGTVVILGEHILVYSDYKKADSKALENYMKKILEDCPYSSIKMYTEYNQFKKRIEQLRGSKTEDENSLLKLKNIGEQIEKNIFIYTI